MATSEELTQLFKALAHPERLSILLLLEGKELCVCEIEEALDLRQAYVSQQLTVLREAGLVCYRKDGWNVRYRISRPEVYTLLEMAASIHDRLGICAVTNAELISSGGSCGIDSEPISRESL
ncbi:MAG: metalloregulator ArsR/SmtB family transcription factor [Anaerolineae bacterium]|jgi:ArsR family transcriptional regulator|nr:metalloregulator ArsR/SmtB family transcription factor [Anaerolineae bacterium]